ncbi:MAG: RnfABCDGE type electron transport complex subunit G [Desulfobacterales bacterium]
MIKMIIVLTILATLSGGLLAAIRDNTQERIENQVLEFVKGPAIRSILKEATNDPIVDRFQLKVDDVEHTFFVGVFEGEPRAVTFETSGKGYGGDVGLMVGIDVTNNQIVGVGVTTHAETPGMGAKAQTDPSFVAQFRELPLDQPVNVTTDGGNINAISGATITSRAVTSATNDALKIFEKAKPQLTEKLQEFK